MKLFAVFLISLLMATPGLGQTDSSDEKDKIIRLLSEENADHLLLVGFTDSTINHLKSSASPNSYRPRGGYGTSTWSERVTDALAEDYDLEKMAEWPMTAVGVHCVVYRVDKDHSVEQTIKRLTTDERVEVVQNMHVFTTKTSAIQKDPYFKLQANLKEMDIDLAHKKATGKNITIGLIDTGVDIEHPDLSGQVTQGKNFAEEISPTFSTDIHGTAVAGVMVAKRENATGIIGVAPSAKVIALKACWPKQQNDLQAVCNSFTLALAINTAIKEGVNILNMSLTGPEDPIVSLLLKDAMAKGIFVIAADTGSKNVSDNFPASLKDVISVQAVEKQPSQVKGVAAPGEKILTTLPHGTYDFISGSSIAAAEISGVIALMLELKPDLNLTEAKSSLQKSKTNPIDNAIQSVNANLPLNSLCETGQCSEKFFGFALLR